MTTFKSIHFISVFRKHYASAVEWLEAAENVVGEKSETDTFEIRQLLSEMREEHDSRWRDPADVKYRGKYPNEEFFVERIHLGNIVRSGRELRDMERGRPVITRGDMASYKRLCQGETILEEELQDRTCRLFTFHPSFILAPLHFERLSTDPPVVLFHDLLTSEEMKFMQFSILSEMKISTVQDTSSPGATKVTEERTQASAWLWDEESELLHSMSRHGGIFFLMHFWFRVFF